MKMDNRLRLILKLIDLKDELILKGEEKLANTLKEIIKQIEKED